MDEECLLCGSPDLHPIKSHFTPAAITKWIFGKRNSEHIYSITPWVQSIDEFFGRAHPQQQSTAVKDAPNSKKGIFCKKCEKGFEQYESAVQEKLLELISSIGHGADIKRSPSGLKYLEVDINPNLLSVYLQSIVWRQCLQQTIEGAPNPLKAEQFQSLTEMVAANITVPIKEMKKREVIRLPKMSFFSSYNTTLSTAVTFVNPHTIDTNPMIFFVGSFIILYWPNERQSPHFTERTKINQHLLSDFFTIDKKIIGIVNESAFLEIHKVLAKSAADQWNK